MRETNVEALQLDTYNSEVLLHGMREIRKIVYTLHSRGFYAIVSCCVETYDACEILLTL